MPCFKVCAWVCAIGKSWGRLGEKNLHTVEGHAKPLAWSCSDRSALEPLCTSRHSLIIAVVWLARPARLPFPTQPRRGRGRRLPDGRRKAPQYASMQSMLVPLQQPVCVCTSTPSATFSAYLGDDGTEAVKRMPTRISGSLLFITVCSHHTTHVTSAPLCHFLSVPCRRWHRGGKEDAHGVVNGVQQAGGEEIPARQPHSAHVRSALGLYPRHIHHFEGVCVCGWVSGYGCVRMWVCEYTRGCAR